MGSYWHIVGFSDILLGIPFAIATILHARGIWIDATTGFMHHVEHNNSMQFGIYRRIKDFYTNDIIYLIKGYPMFC